MVEIRWEGRVQTMRDNGKLEAVLREAMPMVGGGRGQPPAQEAANATSTAAQLP